GTWRKQTIDNSTGARRSKSLLASTFSASAAAQARSFSTAARIGSSPTARSNIHTLSARKRRDSSGPYSQNTNDSAGAESITRVYSASCANAARAIAGSRYKTHPQSRGRYSHLWGSSAIESAREKAASFGRIAGA